MAVKYQVSVPVAFFREGSYFIAHSPVLDVSTSGKSFKEVKRRFSEAVNIFFEELSEKGTLGEVLLSLGWKRIDNEWSPPILIAQGISEVNIPIVN